MDPSGLEAVTALDTHGTESLIGCSSMMSCLIISSVTLDALSLDGTEWIFVVLLLA